MTGLHYVFSPPNHLMLPLMIPDVYVSTIVQYVCFMGFIMLTTVPRRKHYARIFMKNELYLSNNNKKNKNQHKADHLKYFMKIEFNTFFNTMYAQSHPQNTYACAQSRFHSTPVRGLVIHDRKREYC